MGGKILLVDDEERMRKLIRDFLVKSGYLVVEAADGEQAYDMFVSNNDISLIIMDVMMPKMDGYETTEEIRKLQNDIRKVIAVRYGEEVCITMILVDIYVPSMNTTYDFQLDETRSVRVLTDEVVEILQRKTGGIAEQENNAFVLCSYENKEVLPFGKTLRETGVKNGSKLFLI